MKHTALGLAILAAILMPACDRSANENEKPNQSPVISTDITLEANEFEPVTLSISATDSDGSIASYAWQQLTGTPVTLTTTDSNELSFTVPSVDADETLTFSVTVTDDDGESTAETIRLSVIANLAPSLSVSGTTEVEEGGSVTLTATAIDADGSIASYAWQQLTGTSVTLASTDSNELSFTAPNLIADETLTFSIEVTDDDGDTTSDEVSINIAQNSQDVVELFAGAYNICALTAGNQAKCWGYGEEYNLANAKAEVIGDEANDVVNGIAAIDFGSRTPISVMTGEYHGCALFQSGNVACWGNKEYVGLNDPALDSSAYVGDELTELGDNLPLVDLGTGRTATQISVGNEHTCALLDNGQIKCWGEGSNGRLGYGSENFIGAVAGEMGDNLPAVDFGFDDQNTAYRAKAVAAGWDYTCAILSNDQLKCWGYNGSAELGYGDFSDRGDEPNEMGNNLPLVSLGTDRSIKQIFAYYQRTCALLDNTELKCWGDNGRGELGLGSGDWIVGNNVPAGKITELNTATDQVNMSLVELPLGDANCAFGGFELIATIGSTNTSGTYCHTENLKLVFGSITEEPETGTYGAVSVVYDFDVNGDGKLDDASLDVMGDALIASDVGVGLQVKEVSAGDNHICLLTSNDEVKCAGRNRNGELGVDNTTSFGGETGETFAAQQPVDFGDGLYAIDIAGSYSYNCAILNNGKVKCWGYDDENGTLGVPTYFEQFIGDGKNSDDVPKIEMGEQLQYVPLYAD